MKSFKKYGEYYDLIYKDKDYERECDFLENILQKYSKRHTKTILDIGCGTGGHAIPMAKRGYDVVGIDASEVMVERAQEKVKGTNLNLEFHVADIRNFNLRKKFDVCTAMFAVMNYLPENSDIQKALINVRKHLKPGSLFISDFWNGLAVLRILPSTRIKIVKNAKRRIMRIASPELEALKHICRVNYRLVVIEENLVVDDIEETHVVRFLFPQEIAHYLEEAGFELLKICPFLDLKGKVDENVWNITAVSKTK
jgi:SAM-dependent methyltransferase